MKFRELFLEAERFLRENPEFSYEGIAIAFPGTKKLREMRHERLAEGIRQYPGRNLGFLLDFRREAESNGITFADSLQDKEVKAQIRRKFTGMSLTEFRDKNQRLYRYCHQRGIIYDLLEEGILIRKTEIPEGEDIEYIMRRTNQFFKEHNSFRQIPGEVTLRKLGYEDLAKAIKRYPGGFREVRLLLREKVEQDPLREFARRYVENE